ncbi:cholecystokinin receptor type A-like [Haliotis rufescens]|uniref:cholecystokinin receptor type A-like n=1 Tax=Haliotis rufescens TaxID=6454 RepID=UPI00201F1CF5|nr:cholecystokinin receptor type A-like [Haliotis rufescens]
MSSTNTTFSDHDVNVHLRRYDDLYANKYLPAIVLVSVLMATGIIGNSLVCFVYLVKFKSSTVRCFIVSLAVIDLINCVISCPFDIADMRYRYTFGSYVVMCKMMRVFVTFTSVSSGLVLIPVAVDRYKKICRPLQKQMDIRSAKLAIGACCTLGVVVGVPASVFYGPRTVTTDIASINGSDCSTPDIYVGTPYPLIYNGFNLTIFLTTTVSLSVLYSLIWCQIRKQRNYRKALQAKSVKCRHSSSCVATDTESVTQSRRKQAETAPYEDNASFGGEREPPSSLTERVTDGHIEYVSSQSAEETASQMSSKKEVPTHDTAKSQRVHKTSPPGLAKSEAAIKKTTLMLFLITLTFVLSFLPHLSLMAARAVNKEFFDKVDTPQFGAFYFFFKSYFINSAFNPIIYSFFNPLFRRELVAVVKRFRCKR